MEAERHALDVREDPVPEVGLGTIRELESEIAPERYADSLDRASDQQEAKERPYRRHVAVDHRRIDDRTNKVWDGHNRCHPHGGSKDRNRSHRPIAGEHPPQQ